MKCTGLFVFVPTYSELVYTNCFDAVAKTLYAMGARGIPTALGHYSSPYISRTRNMALTMWFDLSPSYSHLLFVDSDNGFEAQLILDMLDFDRPIVGAVYPKRKMGTEWVVRTKDDYLITTDHSFMTCEGVGGGVLMVRRDAVASMIEAHPELVDTNMGTEPMREMMAQAGCTRIIRLFDEIPLPDGAILSEDYSFCRRWIELGGEVWGAIGHPVTHMGNHTFEGCFKDAMVPKGHEGP